MEKPIRNARPHLDCPCAGGYLETKFHYAAPPECENRFPVASERPYHREVMRCRLCGHFLAVHDIDLSGIYEGTYMTIAYGKGGLRDAYDRIMALDPSRSDNVGRTERLLAFAASHFSGGNARSRPLTLLDVGSGLCVFATRMRNAGWQCTALDPDEQAARHARDYVGVPAVRADFMTIDPAHLGQFDVVSFNKVLEHVLEPVAMLARASSLLHSGGFVYVELPDGQAAAAFGPEREEFTIDHHHVFSTASVALLAERAGFLPLAIERVREPSGKFTLRAFVSPLASPAKP